VSTTGRIHICHAKIYVGTNLIGHTLHVMFDQATIEIFDPDGAFRSAQRAALGSSEAACSPFMRRWMPEVTGPRVARGATVFGVSTVSSPNLPNGTDHDQLRMPTATPGRSTD
jgi:hypothetical protein